MGSMSYFLPQCRFFANSMSGFEENNERGVEFEEMEKSRSRSEFGSKLNYSIIPRTTLPSSHIDDHDDEEYMKVYHDVSMEKVDLKGNDKSE